jgi:hypothetical protein
LNPTYHTRAVFANAASAVRSSSAVPVENDRRLRSRFVNAPRDRLLTRLGARRRCPPSRWFSDLPIRTCGERWLSHRARGVVAPESPGSRTFRISVDRRQERRGAA